MQQVKKAGLAFLVALTILGAGYLWGARGRWAAEERLTLVEHRGAYSETRRLALAGQLALTRLNFGEASGLFEQAHASAEQIVKGLEQSGSADAVAEVAKAATALTEARALAAKLDQAAAGKASDALAILDRAATAIPVN